MFLRRPFRTLGIVLASILVGITSLLWISESPIANDELDKSSMVSNEPQTKAIEENANSEKIFENSAANDAVIQEILPVEVSAEVTPVTTLSQAETQAETAASDTLSENATALPETSNNPVEQQPAAQQAAAIPTDENQNSSAKESTTDSTTNTQAKTDANLEVIEFVLANKIEAREPEVVETFTTADQKGYAFARLSAKTDSPVTFVWFHEGRELSRFSTNVHSAKQWRTFASTKLRPGNWKVQLISGTHLLAERAFTVQESNQEPNIAQ